MMPLNHRLRICTAGYKLNKLQEKDQLPYLHARHQAVWKTWKWIGNSPTHSENIRPWRRAGIWHVENKKQETTRDGPNQYKIRTPGEKETYNYLGIFEADSIKQVEMKEKIKKE